MKYSFGLIGSGNMGGAIAKAVSRSLKDGILADHNQQRADELAVELGFSAGSNEKLAKECRYLFLGLKPHLMDGMLKEISPVLAEREDPPVLVSMAAGLTTEQIRQMSGGICPVIRIMPNTPVSVGEGVVLYCANADVSAEHVNGFLDMMKAAGKLFPIEEPLIDMATAISGCGPAYTYLILDAIADGGVACGLTRKDSLELAAQTLIGAAKMVLETEKHPDQLKNEVCSPGGSTIQGVRVLEQYKLRAAFMDAVIAAYEKSAALGNN